jgi:hypothetical protein
MQAPRAETITKITGSFVSAALLALVFLLYTDPKGAEAQPGTCDPSQVAAISVRDVEVVAAEPRVRKPTAFSDCCVVCGEQTLEALVPTPQGPQRLEAGGLPLRRKFCGTVAKYGVNDEQADPRDIMLNILPAPVSPYPDFVAGFVNTEDTPLRGDDIRLFGPRNPFFNPVPCDVQACLRRAATIKGKVIHAEVTPDEHFYGADGRFLPIESSAERCGNKKCMNCIDGWDCQSELESHGGLSGAEVCVYGVYAYDHGGHSASSHKQLCCANDAGHDRPEIHPFDAIWWRHPERKGWMFGVFQDDSNRYSSPYCGDNNGNEWSQAPRDLTFRFPFRFPRGTAPQKVCLRHVRTRNLKDNAANVVRPLNVTTGVFVTPQTEVVALTAGGQRLLEVVKESGTDRETHVRVEGRVVGADVVGQIILRVVVGTGPRAPGQALFDSLRQANGLVTYDKGDPGAGYFYAELTFGCACP